MVNAVKNMDEILQALRDIDLVEGKQIHQWSEENHADFQREFLRFTDLLACDAKEFDFEQFFEQMPEADQLKALDVFDRSLYVAPTYGIELSRQFPFRIDSFQGEEINQQLDSRTEQRLFAGAKAFNDTFVGRLDDHRATTTLQFDKKRCLQRLESLSHIIAFEMMSLQDAREKPGECKWDVLHDTDLLDNFSIKFMELKQTVESLHENISLKGAQEKINPLLKDISKMTSKSNSGLLKGLWQKLRALFGSKSQTEKVLKHAEETLSEVPSVRRPTSRG